MLPSQEAFTRDPYLVPFRGAIECRYVQYLATLARIESISGSLMDFSGGYKEFGLNFDETRTHWILREYIPHVHAVFLTGDFNEWSRSSHPLFPDEHGRWSIRLSRDSLAVGSRYKLHVVRANGEAGSDHVPAWTRRAVQDVDTALFDAVVVVPEAESESARTTRPFGPGPLGVVGAPVIYECHVGMCGEEPRVHTYRECTASVVPRAADLGYNTIQLMAIQEHAYYGSFGYHVTSYFAASSRFGEIIELEALITAAHVNGTSVIMDIVHSHASLNFHDGIAWSAAYTYPVEKRKHPAWDSALFDYGNIETLRFLLSNIRYWVEEVGFDGFRFDGVTSMLYEHHGVGCGFTGGYAEYFGGEANTEAVVYLMLATSLIRELEEKLGRRVILSVAEDVSGMPLLCRPVNEGGVGFDYRLGMAIPDVWIKYLKTIPDEDWDIGHLAHTLTNRRYLEKVIAYSESHDQAIVGDKTLMMWLMGTAIYTDMGKLVESVIADRAVALHKLIRLVTLALGGQGWLGFFGNEFGHPEWIDFPREGNGWSYKYCRRQWSLGNSDHLRYKVLGQWEKAVLKGLVKKFPGILEDQGESEFVLETHDIDKLLVFEKAGLLFVFNFHTDKAVVDREILTHFGTGMLELVLCSDDRGFGGFGRITEHKLEIRSPAGDGGHGMGTVKVYVPPRVALVYVWTRTT